MSAMAKLSTFKRTQLGGEYRRLIEASRSPESLARPALARDFTNRAKAIADRLAREGWLVDEHGNTTKREAANPRKKSSAQLDRDIATASTSKPRFNADQEPDPRIGFYYVTAIDGPRSARIAGPYPAHAVALDKVAHVKELAEGIDPRATWWAWGTMRSERDLGPGSLGIV